MCMLPVRVVIRISAFGDSRDVPESARLARIAPCLELKATLGGRSEALLNLLGIRPIRS